MNRVEKGYYNDRFFQSYVNGYDIRDRRPCRDIKVNDCFGKSEMMRIQKGDSVRAVLFWTLAAFGVLECDHPAIYEECRLFDGARELPPGALPDDVQSVFLVKPMSLAGLDNPEQVKMLLRHENYLRTHPSVQSILRAAPTDDAWMDMITDLTFRPAARSAGLRAADVERAVAVMKSAADIWKDDREFIDISLWRKYNRASDVEFKVGDKAPHARIFDVRTRFGRELFHHTDEYATIVVSSSIT